MFQLKSAENSKRFLVRSKAGPLKKGGEVLDQLVSYIAHLTASLVLLMLFVGIYARITPMNEFALIRSGNIAAICSLAGAVFGFSLTLASSLTNNDSIEKFLMWSALAMVVQVLTFGVLHRCLSGAVEKIESNNVAMGALVGGGSLVMGLVNAACLS